MQTITAVKATEQEIVELINKRFEKAGYDSIVAMEEIGNQDWVVDVFPAGDTDMRQTNEDYSNGESMQFRTSELLNVLCLEKVIPAGEYLIDCTW
jgi:hypothetical protein